MQFIILLTSIGIIGASTGAFAFESDHQSGMAVQHHQDARETMQELEQRGEEKVDRAKGNARMPDEVDEIQTRTKENINNKIDEMKEGMTGR